MITTERKEREKADRRMDILNAAREVFFQYGFEHTSMERVAERALLAKGTLYLYFKSKEELYLSLVEEGTALLNQMIEAAISEETCPIEQLVRASEAYTIFTTNHRDYWRIFMMMDLGGMVEKVDSERLNHFRHIRRDSISRLENLVSKAQEMGLIRNDLPAKELFLMLWGATLGAVMMSFEKCSQLEIPLNLPPHDFVLEVSRSMLRGMSPSFETRSKGFETPKEPK